MKEQLLAIREIVSRGQNYADRCGCLEDALLRVCLGLSWFSPTAQEKEGFPVLPCIWSEENLARQSEIKTLPPYLHLMTEMKKTSSGYHYFCLWVWSDNHTIEQRLELIDAAIGSLGDAHS